MSAPGPGSFQGLVGIHDALIRNPETAAAGDALHPGRLNPPEHWTPNLEPKVPYEAVNPAELGLGGHATFHEVPETDLDRAIVRVIDVEGPVHFNVLADRLLMAAGVGRLGSRIRERILSHLHALAEAGTVECRDDFVGRWQQFHVPRFRGWGNAPDKTRRLDHVHDSELMLCLSRAVVDGQGVDIDTIMNDGVYVIGFIRLTEGARERLRGPIKTLRDMAILTDERGFISLGPNAFLRKPGERQA